MDEKIETFDAKNGVGVASGKPPTAVQGPRRRAPRYYAGETYGKRRIGRGPHTRGRSIQHPDVERWPSGHVVGIRDKAARRLIRGALKRKFSSPERGLRLPRAMLAQALEMTAKQEQWKGRGPRAARRLYEAELALHQPVFVPSKKEIRAARTQARKEKRAKAKANKKMLRGMVSP